MAYPVPQPGNEAAPEDDADRDGPEELDGDDFDDEDFALDEDDEDDPVRHGEVPASAELQITRVLPRVPRD